MTDSSEPKANFSYLYQQFISGRIDRRQFLGRSLGFGISAVSIAVIAQNSIQAAAQGTPTAGSATSGAPAVGTEQQTRGAGGDLRILTLQGASQLSVHNATGGKDIDASSIVSEPLLHYAVDTSLVPNLVTAVPTRENGLLAADLSTATFTLRPNLVWSDGQPVTADDVVFTWQWNVEPANQSIDAASWETIAKIEAADSLTAKVTFAHPTLGWFQPFTANIGAIYPKHFWAGKDPAKANKEFAAKPVGTGPYIVESLSPNDEAVFVINDHYRDPNKPFFKRVILKGGGDASSAVRAVTETGDWDMATTVQIDPTALKAVLGDKGTLVAPPATGIEKLQLNFSDPRKTVDGQRSQKDTPHPFLTDPAVRKAIATALDRKTIAERLYGPPQTNPPARNILTGIAMYESPNTSWTYDPAKANAMLDAAGWKKSGNVREKNGVKLEILYTTTINAQRQKVQAVVKRALEEIGFSVQLRQIDGSVFFDSAPGNDQNFTHFYSDIQEYTDGLTAAYPINYMKYWYAGPNGENIAQRENNWTGTNKARYRNARYDEVFTKLSAETDPKQAAAAFIELNDMLVDDVAEVPLVNLSVPIAVSKKLRLDNIAPPPLGSTFWNLANWNLA